MNLEDVFGPRGALTFAVSAFEERPGQLEMARAVERALGQDQVLIAEAGTGTGKTLAYLVPALLSGKRVVISTATRALQEQIAFRDLPLLERALGIPVRAALMKGLGNYLCLRRFRAARRMPDDPGGARKLSVIHDWAEHSLSGDIGELGEIGENDPILGQVTASSETRLGAACEHHAECFVTRMKQRASDARIVVVNHHLFFADLALRGPHPGRVIPDYDAVVFDEAHKLEETASIFFSVRVTSSRLEALCDTAWALAGPAGTLALSPLGSVSARAVDVAEAGRAFFDHVRRYHAEGDSRVPLKSEALSGTHAKKWHALDQALDDLAATCEAARGRTESEVEASGAPSRTGVELEALGRRSTRLREELCRVVEGAPGHVAWIEAGARSTALFASPIDLAPILRRELFQVIPAVVLTSATVADRAKNEEREEEPSCAGARREGGAFRYLRSRLGLTEVPDLSVAELIVPAPFDFTKRALLYIPNDLPDPRDQQFGELALLRVLELLSITRGGAFVLTTSNRSLRELSEGLRVKGAPYLLLTQGQAPKHLLLERFREDGNAVLVATMSFWEGVDVPGDALRLVIMDKIPFPAPGDPLTRARSEHLEQNGKSSFSELFLPEAKMMLKQGFGRLLRHRSDAGVVAVLDPRLTNRGYGRELVAALPDAPRTDSLEQVREFWDRIGGAASLASLAP